MIDPSAENASTTRRCYQALWNDRDMSVIGEWIAPGYVGHFTSFPGPVQGPAGFSAFVDVLFTAFPDLRMSIEDLVAHGDQVVSRVALTGTHLGPMQGYAATGMRIATTFVGIERYRDGQCVEEWVYADDLGLARQIGALPLPGSAAERIAKWAQRGYAWRSRRRHSTAPTAVS